MVDHEVKSVSVVREVKSSAVPTLQTTTEEKRKSASEKTPLTDETAVPVVKSSDDERKSLFFPASSSSRQNSELQSDVSSAVKAQQMGVRSGVGEYWIIVEMTSRKVSVFNAYMARFSIKTLRRALVSKSSRVTRTSSTPQMPRFSRAG